MSGFDVTTSKTLAVTTGATFANQIGVQVKVTMAMEVKDINQYQLAIQQGAVIGRAFAHCSCRCQRLSEDTCVHTCVE